MYFEIRISRKFNLIIENINNEICLTISKVDS